MPSLEALGELGVALVVTDAAGTVLRASAAATNLLAPESGRLCAALHPSGTFFGVAVDDLQALASLHRFFGSDEAAGSGAVTLAGSRRHVQWTARRVDTADADIVRLFFLRDGTAEHRFEALKGDFVATVSHELRTPLTSLRGSLQLVLARGQGLPQTDRELLTISVKSAERLIRLINDLLDIDRLEQGSIPFRLANLDVPTLVTAAVNATAAAVAARGVTVAVDLERDLPVVHGDGDRLAQVLINLLDNAGKHAPSGSTVTVRARAHAGGVEIAVADAGPGIPAAAQPHVFERFARVDRGEPEAGAGLGLAICRAIVTQHGGRIALESADGQGATFTVFLPLSIYRGAPDEAAPPRSAAAPGGRVLLIEDDDDACLVLRAALEARGYEVVEAATGPEGVALARSERPAAIVLDLVLPELSGYDVLRILKHSPDTEAIPVVVLSVEPEVELARRLGAWDALRKPLDIDTLHASLLRARRDAARPESAERRLVIGFGSPVSRELGVLAAALEHEGHEVYRAPDTGELVSWSLTHFPDLLVLDDDFLAETCAEAAEMLRASVREGHVPLIFLTSDRNGDHGGGGWVRLRKPITKDEFLLAVRDLRAAGGANVTPVAQ